MYTYNMAEGLVKNHPKLSYEEAKAIVHQGQLEKLGRSLAQQTEYRTFREKLNGEWASIADYVMVSKLSFRDSVNAQGKRVAVIPDDKENRTILLQNDFPYYFTDDVGHYVLWKIGGELLPSEIEAAQAEIRDNLGAVDSTFYINPPTLKSILDIEHAHILFKKGENHPA